VRYLNTFLNVFSRRHLCLHGWTVATDTEFFVIAERSWTKTNGSLPDHAEGLCESILASLVDIDWVVGDGGSRTPLHSGDPDAWGGNT